MTRFARAKGSKASNERVPEEATTWTEMKQQLQERVNRDKDVKKQKVAEQERSKNYREFLKEKENEVMNNSKWADLSDLKGSVGTSSKNLRNQKRKLDEVAENKAAKKLKVDSGVLKKPKKDKANEQEVVDEAPKTKKKKNLLPPLKPVGEMTDKELLKLEKKKQRRQRQAEKRKMLREQAKSADGAGDEKPKPLNKKKLNKKPTNASEKLKESIVEIKPKQNLTDAEKKKIEKKKLKHTKQLEKRKQHKEAQSQESGTQDKQKNFTKTTNNKLKTLKPKQKENLKRNSNPKPNKEAKRRKPLPEIERVVMNGKDVELIRFDGYPVKKDDFERLVQLRKDMISKGIPRSEVKETLKLERRKAEKALAREKKNVCFNCRKSGHLLSECPNLNDETSGTGICFKCGSTEHTHFECRVVRSQDFKFATCFICNEQGHIARQCPDNAKGLYPKGGACKVCGDVTHLKKDCPKFQVEQESNNIYAEKISNNSIDALEFGNLPKLKNIPVNRSNKIVKF